MFEVASIFTLAGGVAVVAATAVTLVVVSLALTLWLLDELLKERSGRVVRRARRASPEGS